jgi:hypothetical protein
MRTTRASLFRHFALVAASMSIGFVTPTEANAHGEPAFQLGSERVAPGDVVEVRGDLGVGSSVAIVLINTADGTRRSIASLADFEEGHFQGYVTIPADLAAGDYLVEAGVDSVTLRAPLTVAGSPVGGGGERPDQDEPLIVPLPSGWSGYAFETPAAGSHPGPVTDGQRETLPLPPGLIAVLVVLGSIGLLGGMRRAARAWSRAG